MTEPAPTIQLNCVRCGHALPPLSADEQRLFTSAGGNAVAQHPPGQCPPEQAARAAQLAAATAGGVDLSRPRTRVFEAKLTLTELKGDLAAGGTAEREVITDFVATVEGTTAAAVMAPGGPLATALGEKWMLVAEHIGFADVPAVPGAPAPTL